jgi:hypothetical protein
MKNQLIKHKMAYESWQNVQASAAEKPTDSEFEKSTLPKRGILTIRMLFRSPQAGTDTYYRHGLYLPVGGY